MKLRHALHALHHRIHAHRPEHLFEQVDAVDSPHHRRHAGRGPFGGRGGSDFLDAWDELRGGAGRRGGRMFGHGDLKLLLLALIEQQPRHGYELIRIIEDMFHGQYSPSPGAIYPTLTMLEELGYAEVSAESGGRKLYSITGAGKKFLEENREEVEAVMARTEHSARMAAKRAAPMLVRKAMHALKHALLMRVADWDTEEAKRVAAIIDKAAKDIAAGDVRGTH